MRHGIFTTLTLATGLVAGLLTPAEAEPPTTPEKPTADREALERAFAERLSNAALIGTYSIVGRTNGQPARPERYEIAKVTKTADGKWAFQARVKYGDVDVVLPALVLDVYWAGDTPVISLTDFTIPVLGTFTARVMVYGDRYAGTWQHGKVGGHMWGRIVPVEAKKPAADAEDEKPSSTR